VLELVAGGQANRARGQARDLARNRTTSTILGRGRITTWLVLGHLSSHFLQGDIFWRMNYLAGASSGGYQLWLLICRGSLLGRALP
jgi:hypothetical protein